MQENEILDDDYEGGDDGMKWDFPQCTKCIYCDGKMCRYFKTERIKAPTDIFNCKAFVSEEDKASEMLGVDFDAN